MKVGLGLNLLVLMISTLVAQKTFASEVVEVPEEELAQESVYPRFDRPDNIKNRNIATKGRIEVGGYFGWNFTEPIYNQGKLGFNVGYHLSEDAAIAVNYAKWMSGLNKQYTDGLSAYNLDFNRAPKKNYSLFVHYELKTYYGKISLTKRNILNLSLYPIFGGGLTAFEHKNYLGLDIGVGQKFYFSKNLALRVDAKFQFAQSPSPFLGDPKTAGAPSVSTNYSGTLSPGQFEDKWGYSTIVDIGFSFLF